MTSSATIPTTKDTDSTAGAFTPGPWVLDGPDTFGDFDIAGPDGPLAIAAVVNGEFRRMGGKWSEHEANARLIAAAPEMYAEMGRLINFVQSVAALCDVHYAHLDKALAALAKAEGRS